DALPICGAGARPLEVIFHGGNPTRHFTHWQVTRKGWAQAGSSPLSRRPRRWMPATRCSSGSKARRRGRAAGCSDAVGSCRVLGSSPQRARSEEHTSELQSRFDLVCRLLLEKKKK